MQSLFWLASIYSSAGSLGAGLAARKTAFFTPPRYWSRNWWSHPTPHGNLPRTRSPDLAWPEGSPYGQAHTARHNGHCPFDLGASVAPLITTTLCDHPPTTWQFMDSHILWENSFFGYFWRTSMDRYRGFFFNHRVSAWSPTYRTRLDHPRCKDQYWPENLKGNTDWSL